jgi:hypothetical protein
MLKKKKIHYYPWKSTLTTLPREAEDEKRYRDDISYKKTSLSLSKNFKLY